MSAKISHNKPMFAAFLDRRLSDADVRRLATSASLSLAIFLVLLKLVGSLLTDSVSLLSSLVDSASDIVASLGTFVGVRAALVPADSDHRYGHGKAEAMAALGTAAFILGSACFLTVEAVSRLMTHYTVSNSTAGSLIMVVSMALTYALVRFQKYAVKRTGSHAIAADEVHYTADFLANGATIAALMFSAWTQFSLVDAFFGIGIAAWLVFKAVPVARTAVDMLMDKELPLEAREHILSLSGAHPLVKGIHDLRTRQSGSDKFVELHVELDANLTLKQAHAVGEQIEQAIRQEVPGADIIMHFDPEGVVEWRRDDQIEAAS